MQMLVMAMAHINAMFLQAQILDLRYEDKDWKRVWGWGRICSGGWR
jgi:hypothetical protein